MSVRIKLILMMFLQYAVWGSWAVSMGGYMGGTLGFKGTEIGAIYSTTAIAAMISPFFMGVLADRLFATERLIGALHLIGAGLLATAATTTDFKVLYPVMLIYALCYMPTLALTNSISFANIGNAERDFPGIRVGGTWGWIVAGWIVGFVLGNEEVKAQLPAMMARGNAPIFLASALSAILGVFSFFLPHTPPQGKSPASSVGGISIGQLLRDPSFLVFVVCSFLICIPLSFYYGFANVFLTEIDAPFPTALQTIGQISEVGFMAAMPFFIAKMGVKRMLAVGMLAWVVRYFCFGSLQFPLIVFGLVLHGICYDFFFVASQIYVDNRVSVNQRASAQSFIAFVTMGVGMFVGAFVGGETFDLYPPLAQVSVSVEADGKTKTETRSLPDWKLVAGSVDKDAKAGGESLSLNALPPEIVSEDVSTKTRTIYTATELRKALNSVGLGGGKAEQVTHAEWRKAQEHQWFYIWLWPAIAAGVTAIVFMLFFRNPVVVPVPEPVTTEMV